MEALLERSRPHYLHCWDSPVALFTWCTRCRTICTTSNPQLHTLHHLASLAALFALFRILSRTICTIYTIQELLSTVSTVDLIKWIVIWKSKFSTQSGLWPVKHKPRATFQRKPEMSSMYDNGPSKARTPFPEYEHTVTECCNRYQMHAGNFQAHHFPIKTRCGNINTS